MSTPMEQGRAIAQARSLLSELCVPSRLKRVPQEVRREARNCLKHFPMSWDLPRIVNDDLAMRHMEDAEAYYREQFWKEVKNGR